MARCFVSKNDILIIDGTLKNQYSYEAIQTDPQYGSPGNSAFPDYKSVSSSSPACTRREERSSFSTSSWQPMHSVAHGTATSRFSLMFSPQRTHWPY